MTNINDKQPRHVDVPVGGLTDDDLVEFTILWAQEFHEVLQPEQARERASQLLQLFLLLARPLPEEPQETE